MDAMRTQSENLLQLKALMEALTQEQAEAFARGDEQRAAALRVAMNRVHSLEKPTIEQNYQDMVAASAAWRARLK